MLDARAMDTIQAKTDQKCVGGGNALNVRIQEDQQSMEIISLF